MKGLLNLGSDYVYRALRTDEDPYKNIVSTAPNSKRCIDEHVKDGLKFPSRYISTSVSFELADKWRTTSYKKNLMKYKRGTTIVKIDINYIKRNHLLTYNSAYDFTKRENRNLYLDGRSSGYARGYREVVFDRSIPFQAISNIYIQGKGWVGTQRPLPTPVSAPTTSTIPASSIPNLNHNPTPVSTSTISASSIPNLNHNPTPVSTSTIPASSIPNLNHNPTPVTTSTISASSIPNLNHNPTPVSTSTISASSIPNLNHNPTPVSTSTISASSIPNLNHNPTPVTTSTTSASSIPNLNHNPTPVTTLSVHPTSSTQSISHVIDTNDNTVGTEAIIIIVTSTPISSPSHFYSPFDLSEDTDTYLSALETSADIIDVTTPSCDTAEKRSTGVKRSCEVDSEVKPAKYVCVVE